MNLKNLLLKFSFALAFVTLVSGSLFAQTNYYVNNTTGDDVSYNGLADNTAFETIAKAIAAADSGDVINVAADTYGEPKVTINKGGLTFVVYDYAGSSTALISNGVELDVDVTVAAEDGDNKFGVTGGIFKVDALLNLVDGVLTISTAGVMIADDDVITRTDGSLSVAPTFEDDVSVTYANGAGDVTAGPELPADVGTGTVLVNVGATETVTFGNALTAKKFEVDGGTADFQANLTVIDVVDVAAATTLQLNANTLNFGELVGAGVAVGAAYDIINAGDIISTTAATEGNAKIVLVGDKAIDYSGGGEIPNLEIPAAFTSTFTVSSDIDVVGDLTLAADQAGALTWAAGQTVTVVGDFLRTDNTVGNIVPATGVLKFEGAANQTFNPGSSLVIYSMTVDNVGNTVSLVNSVEMKGNLTITNGTLDVGDNLLRFKGATANVTFDNSGTALSSTGVGYLIFENVGFNTTLKGSGVFSNIDIRSGVVIVNDGANVVKLAGNIILRGGTLTLTTAGQLVTASFATTPVVTLYAGAFTHAVGSDLTCATGVTYDLNIINNAAGPEAAGPEWIGASLRNLTITKGTANGEYTGPAEASTVVGTISVAKDQVLDANEDITVSTDGLTHTIAGTLKSGAAGDELIVTGNGITVTGSTTGKVNSIQANLTAAETLTVTGLMEITNNLTLVNGAASVSLEDGATHGGDLTVTAGTLTYTRGDDDETIGGDVTLTAGALVLGEDVSVTGATAMVAGDLNLNGKDYTQLGSGAAPDFNRTGAGEVINGGNLIFNNTAAAITVVVGATFSVENVEFIGGANGTAFDAAWTVSNSLTWTSGDLTQSAGTLTLSGSTMVYKAGTYTGSFTFTGNTIATLYANMAIPTMVINTDNGVTFQSDKEATPVARTVTVATLLTQTKGDVAIGINTFILGTELDRTAGDWSMSTVAGSEGWLKWTSATAANFDQGTSFSVPNLWVDADLTAEAAAAANAWTVSNYLKFGNHAGTKGDINMGVLNYLNIGAGATIERLTLVANAAFDFAPKFLGNVNLAYSGDAGAVYVPGKEWPTTDIIDDLTVAATCNALGLQPSKVFTINGILTVNQLLNLTGSTATMADGSWLVTPLAANVNAVLGQAAGDVMNVKFTNVTDLTTTDNFFDKAAHTIGEVKISGAHATTSNVILHATAPISYTDVITFEGAGNLDASAIASLTLSSNLVQATGATGWLFNDGADIALKFTGAVDQTLTLQDDLIITTNGVSTDDHNFDVEIALTTGKVLTVSGGDLDFATASQSLALTSGVVATGATDAIVLKQSAAGGVPNQGFTRTAGHVVGNVRKHILNTGATDAQGTVIFPVGSLPSSPAYYRPATFFFTTDPTSSFDLTVNHDAVSPNGDNGISPGGLDGGNGVTITNYPDFFWYVKTDMTLSPSYKFDVEFQAEGYAFYETDAIEDMRIIRRDSGNVANEWRLQGTGVGDYDNSTIATTWPVVKVIDAQGGLTSQGSRFAYSQSNRAPVIAKAVEVDSVSVTPTAVRTYFELVTIDEDDTLEVKYSATDADIGQTPTLTMLATPSATNATLWEPDSSYRATWITTFADSGDYYMIMSASDTFETTYDTLKVRVNHVNRKPVLATAPTDTVVVTAGSLYTYTYGATDVDLDNVEFTWSMDAITPAVLATDSLKLVDSTGVLTWTPDSLEMGNYYDLRVMVADDEGLKDSTVTTFWVAQNLGPAFVTTVPKDTVLVGDNASIVYIASDPNLDVLSFGFYDQKPVGSSLVVSGDTCTFSWTPTINTTAVYILRIYVEDPEGLRDSTETELLVKATTADLTGTVVYNVHNTPIVGAVVTLTQGAVTKTDTTDAAGVYGFAGLTPGTFTVTAAKTTGWGGGTSADALKAALYAVGDTTVVLDALQIAAADVNDADSVTNADALSILNRVVGKTTSFAKADWLFESKSVVVGTAGATQVIKGIATGDVNNSFMAPAALAKESASLIPGDVLKIAPASTFELPIKIDRAVKVGALTLELTYPAEKLEFEGVSSSVGVIYNEVNGKISIAWADLSGGRNALELEESGILAVLQFKAKDAFVQGDAASLSLAALELVDVTGADLNAGISIGSVSSDLPTSFDLSQNYPNPFNPTTAIKYDLVANGKVNLIVYNTLGQEVTRLVNGLTQEAGSYKINWDARNLASGMYIYRLTVEGTQNFVQTKKMILLK